MALVRWNAESVKHSQVERFHVGMTREEIALFFGDGGSIEQTEDVAVIRFSDCIRMTPFTAKRLAAKLNRAVEAFEAENGPVDIDREPAGRNDRKPVRMPRSRTLAGKERRNRLFALVDALRAPCGLERSFKIFKGSVLANRILLGLETAAVPSPAAGSIGKVCELLEMPEPFFADMRDRLEDANIVLFGFEETEDSCIYKVYLEFAGRFEELAKRPPAVPEPFVLHLGYKWDPGERKRRSLARYLCYPGFTAREMLERIENVFIRPGHSAPLRFARDLLKLGGERTDPNIFLYNEAEEENNPRRSFDINMYPANMPMRHVKPVLSEIFRHYGIPAEDFQRLFLPEQEKIFGHLTGGVDRDGRDFLTVYFGEKGSSG